MNPNKPDNRPRICYPCLTLFAERNRQLERMRIDNSYIPCMCLNHFNELWKDSPPAKVKALFNEVDRRMNHEWPPDLREHPELVKAYSEGNFGTGRQSSGQSPVIYAVGFEDLMKPFGVILSNRGLSYRTFTDAHALFEEFASARPRPAVLITGCLDGAGTGLRLIQKCKEIEPRLKVILWSGHSEETLASLLAKVPVIPDASFRKGSEFDTERFLDRIEELVRGSDRVVQKLNPTSTPSGNSTNDPAPMPTLWICGECMFLFEEVRSKVCSMEQSHQVYLEAFWCVNHLVESLEGTPVSDETKEHMVSRWKALKCCPPDLREHPELVEAYCQGNIAAFPSAYFAPSPLAR